MSNRKILCQVIEGIVYEDRCLYKLSKIVEDNKICEECVVRELERMKSGKAGRSDINNVSDIKETKGIKDINDTSKRRRRTKPTPKRKPGSIAVGLPDPEQPYTVQSLSKFLVKRIVG